jgi:nucleotide-binding universal stress UspA family protein
MNEQDEQLMIRRILVALDASRHSLAALEAAAELAASLEAELQGLFVEDANLLRLAGLPVAREVQYPFVAPTRLDRARMERALRAQAAQARQALATVSERHHIKWSFRVARGEVVLEVLAAALEADLLTLGKASRPLTRRVRLGSTAQAAAEGAPCCVLVLQRDVAMQPPVVVTYDGTPTGQKALTMAARLARQQEGILTVMIVAAAPDTAQRLQAEASDLLRRRGLMVRYRRLRDAGSATLTHAARAERSGVLVLSGAILSQEALQTLLDEVDCPVLLVR